MDLRHTTRKKDGKVHRYWRLVRSVRIGRRVIQQTVAHLGELDEHGRLEARALARHLIGEPEQARLFDDGRSHLTVPVRLKGIRVERSRQFGDVYLALALWRGTGLAQRCEELLPAGKEQVPWEKMAAVLVTARLCEPSSELHIAEDWYRRTALVSGGVDPLNSGDEEAFSAMAGSIDCGAHQKESGSTQQDGVSIARTIRDGVRNAEVIRACTSDSPRLRGSTEDCDAFVNPDRLPISR